MTRPLLRGADFINNLRSAKTRCLNAVTHRALRGMIFIANDKIKELPFDDTAIIKGAADFINNLRFAKTRCLNKVTHHVLRGMTLSLCDSALYGRRLPRR